MKTLGKDGIGNGRRSRELIATHSMLATTIALMLLLLGMTLGLRPCPTPRVTTLYDVSNGDHEKGVEETMKKSAVNQCYPS
jgi:hypothetical protein